MVPPRSTQVKDSVHVIAWWPPDVGHFAISRHVMDGGLGRDEPILEERGSV